MHLLSFTAASRERYAPSQQYISAQSKKMPPAFYLIYQDGRYWVDIDSFAWRYMIEMRKIKFLEKKYRSELEAEMFGSEVEVDE